MKRLGKAKTRWQRSYSRLSENDKSEVDKFRAFLQDSPTMGLPALIEKHGAEYLGFTPAEVAAIAAQPKDGT